MNDIKFGNLRAFSQVDVIDSIIITEERDTSKILAEWSLLDSSITVYKDFRASQGLKLFINWSDNNGAIELNQGDFFTFVIPSIFNYDFVQNVTDAEIKNELGEVVATYSIYDNNNLKEIKITFTDYVETHTQIKGNLWLLLFVGRVNTTEQKTLEFIINGNLEAEGEITITPTSNLTPSKVKTGYSLPTRIAGDYYIFEWVVYFNMGKNAETGGFNELENFSFEDILPENSPHIFLTDEIRQELGIAVTDYQIEIGEYVGADSVSVENRYQMFYYHFNSTDSNIWYNFIRWQELTNGLSAAAIDGGAGLDVSDIAITDKIFSANLGTLTRPMAMRFYTLSTIKMTESALGDKEVVKLFQNQFKGNYGEEVTGYLTLYRFESGGTGQGISGDCSFKFTKVNEKDEIISGVMFSLFASEDLAAGADRIAFSDDLGVVSFNNLPEGTYYFIENETPTGFIPNNMVYKVTLFKQSFDIYYGENYENKLSDDNKIVNKHCETQPVSITIEAIKSLTGLTLETGAFNFVVKDKDGNTAAEGFNEQNGSITFSAIELKELGEYTYTVEEVGGSLSGITYDASSFIIKVTVTDEGGHLTAKISYPVQGIVFNNQYSQKRICKRPCVRNSCVRRCKTCKRLSKTQTMLTEKQ